MNELRSMAAKETHCPACTIDRDSRSDFGDRDSRSDFFLTPSGVKKNHS